MADRRRWCADVGPQSWRSLRSRRWTVLAVGVRFWHDSHSEMGSSRTQTIELVLAHSTDLNLHQRIEPYRGTRLPITDL